MKKVFHKFIDSVKNCSLLLLSVVLTFVICGCGQVEFAAQSSPVSPISAPIFTIGSDTYAEIGQELAPQATGEVNLTLAQLFATTTWSGINNLTFEVRVTTIGNTAIGEISVSSTKPAGWDTAASIFNQPVAGGNVATNLQSPNHVATVSNVLKSGKFWVLVRLNYPTAGFGDAFPLTLNLKNVYIYAEGNKSLKSSAPALNLGF